jgi:hypothetical protein
MKSRILRCRHQWLTFVCANAYSRGTLLRFLVTVMPGWGSLRSGRRAEDMLGRREHVSPILSTTYRIGGLWCLRVYLTRTTRAVYRQPSLTTLEHRLYVNPNRVIREFHKKTAGRVIPRDLEPTVKEHKPCRGQPGKSDEFTPCFQKVKNAQQKIFLCA